MLWLSLVLLLCSCSHPPAWSALAIALARAAALALALAYDVAPIWLHFSRLDRLLGQSIFRGWGARRGEGRTSRSGEGGSPERYPTIYLRVQDGGGGRRRWRGVGGAVAWGSPEKKLGTGGLEGWPGRRRTGGGECFRGGRGGCLAGGGWRLRGWRLKMNCRPLISYPTAAKSTDQR